SPYHRAAGSPPLLRPHAPRPQRPRRPREGAPASGGGNCDVPEDRHAQAHRDGRSAANPGVTPPAAFVPRTSHLPPLTSYPVPRTSQPPLPSFFLLPTSPLAPSVSCITIPAQIVCYNEPTRRPHPPPGRPALTPI